MATLPSKDSPHVVILGAGASFAALPNGDRNHHQLPLMQNLVEITGIGPLLLKERIQWNELNFEDIYDEMISSGKPRSIIDPIENAIRHYFSLIQIPIQPTLYDYLLLSLKKNDLIVTFNWDPLLAQAYRRNMMAVELPRIAFLHGNVSIGVCSDHKKVGFLDQHCVTCKKPLQEVPLLFPVKRKDYQSDKYIKAEWNVFCNYLNHSYLVTIFGYSAPKTDAAARELMLNAWKQNTTYELGNIDLVDIRNREELEANWEEFFCRNHYGIVADIFQSYLFTHPRRSCEAFASATLQCFPWKDNPYPQFNDLMLLHRWINPLIEEERTNKLTGLVCPPV